MFPSFSNISAQSYDLDSYLSLTGTGAAAGFEEGTTCIAARMNVVVVVAVICAQLIVMVRWCMRMIG